MLLTNNNIFVYSKVLLYILILEEVTSVNISRCRATRIQDLAGLTTPALLPQLPRAGGPPVFMAQLLTLFCIAYAAKEENIALTLSSDIIYKLLPDHVYNLFI